MGTFAVVVPAPPLNFLPRVLQRQDPTFVEAFSPKPGVEGLNLSVVCRLAWPAEVHLSTVQNRPPKRPCTPYKDRCAKDHNAPTHISNMVLSIAKKPSALGSPLVVNSLAHAVLYGQLPRPRSLLRFSRTPTICFPEYLFRTMSPPSLSHSIRGPSLPLLLSSRLGSTDTRQSVGPTVSWPFTASSATSALNVRLCFLHPSDLSCSFPTGVAALSS